MTAMHATEQMVRADITTSFFRSKRLYPFDGPAAGSRDPKASTSNHPVYLMGGDMPPDRYQQPRGFQIVLQMDDAVAAERVFQSLAENGKIVMPLQETFWAARFGVLVDQFGRSWSINCERASGAVVTVN
jgi:hypothetical protein